MADINISQDSVVMQLRYVGIFNIDICIGLSRYIAITNLSIIAVFLEYLRQFLIDLNQIYRHSSVPKNTSSCIFWAF